MTLYLCKRYLEECQVDRTLARYRRGICMNVCMYICTYMHVCVCVLVCVSVIVYKVVYKYIRLLFVVTWIRYLPEADLTCSYQLCDIL